MSSTSLRPSLVVEQVAIDLLRPDPANPRRISEDELDALERSLRQFGFVQPVLARREDRTVIGGHQRLVAARRLGLTSVPVTWLDISVEQARLLGLALNKISGSWDDALLARLLAELQATPELDISLSGFGEDEIGDLLRSLETREKREHVESFDLDEALEEARRTPRTKPGDLWALGDHRLLCGGCDTGRRRGPPARRCRTEALDDRSPLRRQPRWFLARRRVQRAWPRREDVHARRWPTQR
jgi:ParB-like chromosome segregation protein Spo0J